MAPRDMQLGSTLHTAYASCSSASLARFSDDCGGEESTTDSIGGLVEGPAMIVRDEECGSTVSERGMKDRDEIQMKL